MEPKLQYRGRDVSSQDLQSIVETPTFIELYLNNNDKAIIPNGTLNSVHIPTRTVVADRCTQLLVKQKIASRSSLSTTLPCTEDLNKNEINDLIYKNERKARKRLLKAAVIFFTIVALMVGTMTIVALTMFSKEVITPTPTPKPATSQPPAQPQPSPQLKTPVPPNSYTPTPKPEKNSQLKNNPNPGENNQSPPPSEKSVPNKDKSTERDKDTSTPHVEAPKPDQPNSPDQERTPNQAKPQ